VNTAVRIFLAVFFTFASAWLGLVLFPHLQLRDIRAQVDEVTGEQHPAPYSGEALLGRASYMSLGCTYCHSQQVRGGFWNADLERGWGMRRSHPRDYIYDEPQLLGTMRTGPDLANIGARQPSREWHLLHLYDPQVTSPGSIMPPHRFLFDKREIVGQPSSDALALEGGFAPEDGYEIVPTREAHNLVTYLLSLNQMYEIED
jgi:cytochrome c oxidase cbb3-type subunit 2